MATQSNRYQKGSLERVARAKGPDVWVFRWRELQPDGTRTAKKKIIGDLSRFKNLSAARKAAGNLRAEVNAKNDLVGEPSRELLTFRQLWGMFQAERFQTEGETSVNGPDFSTDGIDEEPDEDWLSPTTIQNYKDNFSAYVLPKWGDVPIEDVKPYEVKQWLRSLKAVRQTPVTRSSKTMVHKRLAPSTKSKIRNQMSALFTFAILKDLWPKNERNPIEAVRQSAKRLHEPEALELGAIIALLAELTQPIHRATLLIAAAAALRRSEIRGLKWGDVDFEKSWLNIRRGVVGNKLTRAKTEASRKGLPLQPELAAVLAEWRKLSSYPSDHNWILAHPDGDGKNPLWLDTVLRDYIRPAAKRAGIEEHITWHTFRHSLGALMVEKKEHVKVAQELLRHANPRITMAMYQRARTPAKRAAQEHMAGLFTVPKAS
jgi:integrase